VQTLGIDERGENALALLPKPSVRGTPVLYYARNLQVSDAWTGTTLRASIEYHCVNLGNPVTLDAPDSDRAFAQLCDLLGPLPQNFHPTRSVPGGRRGLALLPALRVESERDLDAAATTVHYRASGYGEPVARTAAAALAVFVDNALTHASTSPIGVVTTIAYDPDANSVCVVSSNLGPDLVEPQEAETFLLGIKARATASHSNLAHLVEASARRGLSVTLTLAAGPGRLRWTTSGVSSMTTSSVPGFTQALTIASIR
jgi:hypothetical protein